LASSCWRAPARLVGQGLFFAARRLWRGADRHAWGLTDAVAQVIVGAGLRRHCRWSSGH